MIRPNKSICSHLLILSLYNHEVASLGVNTLWRSVDGEVIPIHERKTHSTEKQKPNSTATVTTTVSTQRHPYIVQLLNSLDLSHRCLGTLVASDIVLTAAHCLYDHDIVVRIDAKNDEFNDYNSNATAGTSSNTTATNSISSRNTASLFVVQAIRTHPEYYYNTYTGGVDVDPYDIALLQLYGRTETASDAAVVGLNRNASLPHSHSQLLGVGWKAAAETSITITDSNEFGSRLLLEETVLLYLSNNACMNISGISSTGYLIDYESQIIDVSLCAMYQHGSGLCPGDSGGPLFLYNDTASTSPNHFPRRLLQIGITSASFGCRNAILPTLNVRLSTVSEWIDSTVCELSLYPTPSEFPCSSLNDDSVIKMDDDEESKVELIVELTMNDEPGYLGWLLYQIVDNRSVPVYERPLLSYRDHVPFSKFTETMLVSNNCEYRFVLLDAQSDASGIFLRVLSSQDKGQALVSTTMAIGNNAQSFLFVIGSIPTLSPSSLTPSPTVVSRQNNSSGLQLTKFLTVVIALDGYPTETGFLVEALARNEVSTEPVLVYAVYPGSFGPQQAFEQVLIVVPLSSSSSQTDNETRRYRFTMTDNEGDGLDPPAFYEVWIGPREQGTLVAHGGDFFLEHRHNFVVPGVVNFAPTTAGTAQQHSTATTIPPTSTAGSCTRCIKPQRTIIYIVLLFLLINTLYHLQLARSP